MIQWILLWILLDSHAEMQAWCHYDVQGHHWRGALLLC